MRKQHFIDDECVAWMTPRGSGQAVSFCDLKSFQRIGLAKLKKIVSASLCVDY